MWEQKWTLHHLLSQCPFLDSEGEKKEILAFCHDVMLAFNFKNKFHGRAFLYTKVQ